MVSERTSRTEDAFIQLPDEFLGAIFQHLPRRNAQVRTIATLVQPAAAPCRCLVVYGTEATGKTAVTSALLQRLSEESEHIRYAIVNSAECITTRHLFERIIGRVADALCWPDVPSRCETVSHLTVELCKMLKDTARPERFRFVLVFDAIDRQREAPATLPPALARLSEIIPNITTVFIVTSPATHFLRLSSVVHVHFPAYTRDDLVTIASASPPAPLPGTTAAETAELWTRFASAVHDALTGPAARTLPSFRAACTALWPRFTAPVAAHTHEVREFRKLLVAARTLFQDESLLEPSMVRCERAPGRVPVPKPSSASDLAASLPTTPRLLLLAAYLASHNAPKHDLTLFSTHHHGRRRRGGGATAAGGRGRPGRQRKIAKRLLGGHAFVLERMLAILAAVRREWEVTGPTGGVDADLGMGIATLASLRMLVPVGVGGDQMDRAGKWRVNVGWEVVRGLGRSVGVEIEDWLME